ncbi:hypothetical protein MtrunA17_Chr2g0299451 [Medicago truncatula]|uniref:Transmembrane protein n=1 Tax=Medicago truncatula TaxID=3880 RepID=A0A396J5U8_MEDTR|nr:hypothetical protein MtrunA17_Chr2g0299451 [Medicago truncatula]
MPYTKIYHYMELLILLCMELFLALFIVSSIGQVAANFARYEELYNCQMM